MPGVKFSLSEAEIRHLKNPSIDLSRIHILMYYVVPIDIKDSQRQDWQSIIDQAMVEIIQFHASQFKDYSTLNYSLYPKPIIGNKTAEEYSKDDTPTDRKALTFILEEINERVLQKGGDLYDQKIALQPDATYQMNIIFVEGDFPKFQSEGKTNDVVGYGDEKQSAIIYRKVLTDDQRRDYGTSIVYHEIAHNMGLDDQYDYQTLQPTSDDIMGSGRLRPLKYNYIEPKILKQLGLPWSSLLEPIFKTS